MSDSFLVLYDSILRNRISVSFDKVGESYLHHVYPVDHQDGKIDDMKFQPFPPEVSGNSRLLSEKHACRGTEPRREVMWNHCSEMETLICCGM